MSKKLKIRKAKSEDLSTLRKIDPEISALEKDILKYYLKKRGIFIVQNRRNHQIEGFLLSQVLNWVNNKRRIVWIEHIYINPKKKNGEAAQALLDYLKDYYRHLDPNVKYVFGNMNPGDKELIKISNGLQSISYFGKL